ncbi:glycine betaine/L-proline transporter ProP [Candidatus Erwinia haradaeae]|uniref:Proline/betaine transporter, partial n=1 Tax=Candidatus Erwinia haradaeae TaxID=1922217 RepID=A0A803FUL2_9GAMM|nr:glycine betaine/L-proline transporter ProP [Candidatus Erwinia haradaeae]VFP88748.1 Proline/betaine transporter [Candidatus Erwinia haradaeae]
MQLHHKHLNSIREQDINIIDRVRLLKVIIATSLGNACEWFDFGVYGFMSSEIGEVFFPITDPSIQRAAILATFSIPFLIRPFGGLVFGALGDRYGRQKILSITIIVMSVSTACISFIPSYSVVGVWSPLFLILCRMLQGFSVGGEYAGAAIFVSEYAPDHNRGFIASWLDFSSISGFVLGAGVVIAISSFTGKACFLEWGWRIPFFMAIPLGLIGLYLRYKLDETPIFYRYIKTIEKNNYKDLLKGLKIFYKEIVMKYWKSFLTSMGLVLTTNVIYYVLLTYMPGYLSYHLHYDEDEGLIIISLVMLVMLFLQPVIGLMSDKVGHRPLVIIGSIALLCLSIPSFMLINSGRISVVFFGFLVLAIILNSFTGVIASSLPAMFPTSIRYRALASSFNIAMLAAGLTPAMLSWLVEVTGDLYVPAYCLMTVSVIGLFTGIVMKETANVSLHSADFKGIFLSEDSDSLEICDHGAKKNAR